MSYTKYIKQDAACNYLNLEVDNANKMLLSCINKNKYPGLDTPVDITSGTCNGKEIIEGFSSDMGLGGVNYVENGKCPVGHTKMGEKCLQVCTHCNYEDDKGYFGDIKPTMDICGSDSIFDGIDYNGFVRCNTNPYIERKKELSIVEFKGYNADSTFDKLLSFFN